MLRALDQQEGMPAVRCLPHGGGREVSKRKYYYVRTLTAGRAPNDWHHRWHRLGRPEDGLLVERPLRVMGESRRPISFRTRGLRARLWRVPPGSPVDIQDCGEGAPTRNLPFHLK